MIIPFNTIQYKLDLLRAICNVKNVIRGREPASGFSPAYCFTNAQTYKKDIAVYQAFAPHTEHSYTQRFDVNLVCPKCCNAFWQKSLPSDPSDDRQQNCDGPLTVRKGSTSTKILDYFLCLKWKGINDLQIWNIYNQKSEHQIFGNLRLKTHIKFGRLVW